MSLKINNKQILYPLSGSFIGSFSGSISNAISASFSVSSSMANNANTASYILPLTQSVLITGSFDHQGTFKVNELTYPIVDNGEESFMQTDGNGNLSLQYVKTIYEEVFNGESTILLKGTPVYVSGSVGAASMVFRADPTNINKMPAVYIIADNIAPGNPGKGIALGLIKGVDTTGYPAGTEIYLAAGGGWTSTRPTGSTIIQILGYVTKEGSGGQGVVLNPGPANLPNIAPGNVWVGNNFSTPVATPTSSLNVLSASFAVSSSRAISASFADISTSSSFAVSSSRAISASFSNNTISASFAATASFALNASGGAGFPFVGDAVITGSLTVRSGSIKLRVTNTGITLGADNSDIHTVTGSLSTVGTVRISGSFNTAISGTILTVIGSGSSQPIFTVQGSQGELFSVTDNLSGSLYSVNDISGLPVFEIFSDNTIIMGDYISPMLITTKRVVQTNSGSFIVYSIPTSSYDGAFIEYVIKSGSNARSGQIMSTWAGSTIEFTEVDTMDIGNTTAVGLTMILSGSNAVITGSSTTGLWTIKTIVRAI